MNNTNNMNDARKVLSRKTVKIYDHFTNGFAQQVYKLEDGTQLFIDYNETEVTILQTEPIDSPEDLLHFLNTLPESELAGEDEVL